MYMNPLMMCLVLAHQNIIILHCSNATVALSCLLFLQQLDFWKYHGQFKQSQRHEAGCFDIPLEEGESAQSMRMPRQNLCFESWSCQECRCNTSFRKEALLKIYNFLTLPTFLLIKAMAVVLFVSPLGTGLFFSPRETVPIIDDEMQEGTQ